MANASVTLEPNGIFLINRGANGTIPAGGLQIDISDALKNEEIKAKAQDGMRELGFTRVSRKMESAAVAAGDPAAYIRLRKGEIDLMGAKADIEYTKIYRQYLQMGYPEQVIKARVNYHMKLWAEEQMDIINDKYPVDIVSESLGAVIGNSRAAQIGGRRMLNIAGGSQHLLTH